MSELKNKPMKRRDSDYFIRVNYNRIANKMLVTQSQWLVVASLSQNIVNIILPLEGRKLQES